MQHPACGLLTILLPRTSLNKGKEGEDECPPMGPQPSLQHSRKGRVR